MLLLLKHEFVMWRLNCLFTFISYNIIISCNYAWRNQSSSFLQNQFVKWPIQCFSHLSIRDNSNISSRQYHSFFENVVFVSETVYWARAEQSDNPNPMYAKFHLKGLAPLEADVLEIILFSVNFAEYWRMNRKTLIMHR